MNLTRAKRELLTFKGEHRQELAINKVDIVGLVNTAWKKSFANVRTNKKAISEQGWGPLNYNVLLYSEIQATRTNQKPINEVLTAATTNTLPGELNLRSDYAGTLVERINDFCKRENVKTLKMGLTRKSKQENENKQQIRTLRGTGRGSSLLVY